MKKVIVGLSGGVDSSYAAWLLQQQGYKVQGVFMRNWDDDGDKYCTAGQDFIDACRVADHLKIELKAINFTDEYKKKVFSRSLEMLRCGLTPNPDVWCNTFIKFGALLDYIDDEIDYVATGHYAKILQNDKGLYELHRASDKTKDQTYFLHQLNQRQLSRVLFPLGGVCKSQVRIQAKRVGLKNYDRPDSTGICFIGERPFAHFLTGFIASSPGAIVTEEGKIIGQHKGLPFYTIGQRKGLGIGGVKNFAELPWYVAQKNIQSNTLVVVQDSNHPLLMHYFLEANAVHWVSGEVPLQVQSDTNIRTVSEKKQSVPHEFSERKETKTGTNRSKKAATKCLVDYKLSAIIRYRQLPQYCDVFATGEQDCSRLQVRYTLPQKSVAPGQFVVFYRGSNCLGGGIIC